MSYKIYKPCAVNINNIILKKICNGVIYTIYY